MAIRAPNDAAEWWEGRLPPGCDYLGEAASYAWYMLTEVEPEEVAEEVSGVLILNPDGTTEAAPATLAGWQFYLDTLSGRWPLDDGSDDLPRPVALIRLEG